MLAAVDIIRPYEHGITTLSIRVPTKVNQVITKCSMTKMGLS